MTALGPTLRRLRLDCGLTGKSGFRANPTLDTLARIARVFRMPLSELVREWEQDCERATAERAQGATHA